MDELVNERAFVKRKKRKKAKKERTIGLINRSKPLSILRNNMMIQDIESESIQARADSFRRN
jgi:hypothetical protein